MVESTAWKVVESPGIVHPRCSRGTLECVKSQCFGGCQGNLQQVAPLAYEHAELSNPFAYEHAEPLMVIPLLPFLSTIGAQLVELFLLVVTE